MHMKFLSPFYEYLDSLDLIWIGFEEAKTSFLNSVRALGFV